MNSFFFFIEFGSNNVSLETSGSEESMAEGDSARSLCVATPMNDLWDEISGDFACGLFDERTEHVATPENELLDDSFGDFEHGLIGEQSGHVDGSADVNDIESTENVAVSTERAEGW